MFEIPLPRCRVAVYYSLLSRPTTDSLGRLGDAQSHERRTFDVSRVRDIPLISLSRRHVARNGQTHRTCVSSRVQLAQDVALPRRESLAGGAGQTDRLICFFVGAARCSSRRRTQLQALDINANDASCMCHASGSPPPLCLGVFAGKDSNVDVDVDVDVATPRYASSMNASDSRSASCYRFLNYLLMLISPIGCDT